MATTNLIAEGLFRVDGERAVLFGSRRRSSGAVKFPAERPELFDASPEVRADIEPLELSTEGTLYTFTTQEFPRRSPTRGTAIPRRSGRTWWALWSWPRGCWWSR